MNGVSGILSSKTISALEQMASFTQSRQKVIAENLANVSTPGYRRKQVELGGFQKALAEAMGRSSDGAEVGRVTSEQVGRDERGQMVLRPSEEPAENVMFHDGTNARIEREMSEMAGNQALHQVTMDLLVKKYRGLEAAIRGRMT